MESFATVRSVFLWVQLIGDPLQELLNSLGVELMITHEFWLLFRKLMERCNRAVVRTCQACDAGSKSQNGGVQGAAVLTTTGPYVATFIYVFVLSGTG